MDEGDSSLSEDDNREKSIRSKGTVTALAGCCYCAFFVMKNTKNRKG